MKTTKVGSAKTSRDGRRVFRWVVELEVSETWVEDGFNLDDERALNMLARTLGWATIGTELGARVLEAPPPREVKKARGER